jgi:uncharacterized SAM-dependent methyltransferase
MFLIKKVKKMYINQQYDVVAQEFLDLFNGNRRRHLTKYCYYDLHEDSVYGQLVRYNHYYLAQHDQQIITHFVENARSDLQGVGVYEIGPGNTSIIDVKTLPLLKFFKPSYYVAIDCNQQAAENAALYVAQQFNCMLDTSYIAIDAFGCALNFANNGTNLIMLLGGTIGNLVEQEFDNFIVNLGDAMQEGDMFMFSVDTCIEEDVLKKAYDNAYMARLCGNIISFFMDVVVRDDFDRFAFQPTFCWDAQNLVVSAGVVATSAQRFKLAGQWIEIQGGDQFELIQSRKFKIDVLEQKFKQAGFKMQQDYSLLSCYSHLVIMQKI